MPGYLRLRLEREVGQPARGARDLDRCSTCSRCSGSSSSAGGSAGARLAATLPFAWAAYPFTQYASSSNTNDAIMPAFLIWGFWLVSSACRARSVRRARGLDEVRRAAARAALAFAIPTARRFSGRRSSPEDLPSRPQRAFWILLLEPSPVHAARVFWDRTFGWQVGRDSPFSIWDWGQYHAAGIPDLGLVQRMPRRCSSSGRSSSYFLPRGRSPLQLAALTAALLIGFELVLTHWFYLYIPWFFPFVAFAVLAAPAPPRRATRRSMTTPSRELVPAG